MPWRASSTPVIRILSRPILRPLSAIHLRRLPRLTPLSLAASDTQTPAPEKLRERLVTEPPAPEKLRERW